MSLQPESNLKFLKDTKNAIKSNGFAKFCVLGGAAASVFNAFIYNNSITEIIEGLGAGAAAWIASQALKGNQNIDYMSNQQINKHLTKGAFLAVGGAVLGSVVNALPGPLAHIAHFPTSILLFSGVIAMAEAGYQKFKRR